MAAIGETLRQARLRSGVDLGQLAEKTKINPRFLQAIEAGDFSKLPGGIFARMFVKQYADALGLDGTSFAEELQRDSPVPQPSADLHTLVEHRSGFRPSVPGFYGTSDRLRSERLNNMVSSLIWVVAAILVCAAAYYGLTHLHKWNRETTEVRKVQPEEPNRSGTPALSQVPAKPASPAESAPPGLAQVSNGAANPPNIATTPAPAVPANGIQAPAAPTSGPIQLTLVATEEVWVSVTADGKSIFAGIMPVGTTKSFSASERARLNIGNAGGLEVSLNGRKLEPFGPKGQTRNVEFTPEGAHVISRTPPPTAGALPDPLR